MGAAVLNKIGAIEGAKQDAHLTQKIGPYRQMGTEPGNRFAVFACGGVIICAARCMCKHLLHRAAGLGRYNRQHIWHAAGANT